MNDFFSNMKNYFTMFNIIDLKEYIIKYKVLMGVNMINGLERFFNNVAPSTQTQGTSQVTRTTYANPFANPFLSQNIEQLNRRNEFYGKNNPFPGGYFAGYYNGKPNIVGRQLFVEV